MYEEETPIQRLRRISLSMILTSLRKIFSFCSCIRNYEENLPLLVDEAWKYRCLKVFFWSSSITVSCSTIFLELARRAEILIPEDMWISLGSLQGNERKNGDTKKRYYLKFDFFLKKKKKKKNQLLF